MSRIDDGGPAFPNTGNSTWDLRPDGGMTLRDWFAGQALANRYTHEDSVGETPRHTHEIAHWAYSLADAMLAERAKGGDA